MPESVPKPASTSGPSALKQRHAPSSPNQPSPPKSQKAYTYTSAGFPRDVLSLHASFLTPHPAGDELLVRVTHVGLNPGCYSTLISIPPLVRRLVSGGQTEFVLEGEFSGVVVHVGADVNKKEAASELGTGRHFAAGMPVFGSLPVISLLGGSGVLCEYITVHSSNVAIVPAGLMMAEAAGLSGSGCTAWAMLREVPGLEDQDLRGKRVFVNGSSGGVGMMLVQLAKTMGAYVVGTCSERTEAFVKRLGADEVIDYRKNAPLHAHLSRLATNPSPSPSGKFDLILDTIGTQSLFLHSPAYLTPAGTYINAGSFEGLARCVFRAVWNTWGRWYLPSFLGGVPRKYVMVSTAPDGRKAGMLADMVGKGDLKVMVDEVVGFDEEEVFRAYDRMLAKNAMGKIIVKVSDP